MNVLHLQRRPFPGQVSIERLFAHIRSALPSDVACRVHVSPYPSKGLVQRLRNIQTARREISDVYHITGDVHYLAAGLAQRKTILTIHDCASFERLRGLKREVFKWLWFKIPMRCAAVVTTISEATRQEVVRFTGCAPARIRVIHNCVGPEFAWSPKPFDSEKPVILQVGTGYNKNLERVAEALQGIPCQLHIVGRLSESQKALLGSLKVEYQNPPLASDAEIVKAYKQCDLLVFASTYEGFGLPILEAQATGRPVITSDRLSMPEVAGDAALLVDPEKVISIRTAVKRILADAACRESLIGKGLGNVRRFSPTRVGGEYAGLYREIA